jgi:hypothetical protein
MSSHRGEVLVFRLAIAVSALNFAFFGIRAFNASDAAKAKRVSAIQHATRAGQIDASSSEYETAVSNAANDAKEFELLSNSAEREFYLAWVVPLILFGLFYAVRWAVTTRFHPLWPLRY